jgi:hypothetical protein
MVSYPMTFPDQRKFTKFVRRNAQPWTSGLALGLVALAFAGAFTVAQAQEIANPGFEEPSLEGKGQPIAVGAATRTPEEGWSFGRDAGICRAGGEYAEGLEASEGSQLAFLKGGPSGEAASSGLAPSGVFGAKLKGLEPGTEYEIEWVQTGSTLDEGLGAVTTIVTDPAKPGIRIAKMNRVETKGEWQKCSMKFRASSPVMQLFVAHSIPGIAKGLADGDEVTLLDDFRIRKAE